MESNGVDNALESLRESTEGPVPRLRFDASNGAAFPAPPAREEEDMANRRFRDAYMDAVKSAVPGMASGIHVAVTPERPEGGPTRSVYPVHEFVQIAEAVGRQSERLPQYLDHVVLVDAGTAAGLSREEVAAMAMADLGDVLEDLYPLDADGPIAPVVPALVAMAASLLLSLAREGADEAAAMRDADARLNRRLRDVRSDATRVGGDHPAVAAMARAVEREAVAGARTLAKSTNVADLVRATHEAFAAAVGGLGCRVVASDPD